MARQLKSIECSAQPLCMSFHPFRDVVAAGLVDGTVEVHDLIILDRSSDKIRNNSSDDYDVPMGDDDVDVDRSKHQHNNDELDTILSSIFVAKESTKVAAASHFKMLAKMDSVSAPSNKAAQGPSCRCVLFSDSEHNNPTVIPTNNITSGGDHLFTACNGGSLRCLDTQRICSLDPKQHDSSILWSVENAHHVGISKLYQLPHNAPPGPLIVTGDDSGAVRLWDSRICRQSKGSNSNNNTKQNPFDNLMKPPQGCVMQWKVNHDYITDFTCSKDGSHLLATSADGTLSVFDTRFVHRKHTPRSVILPEVDLADPNQQLEQPKQTWEKSGYIQSDNQEDELLALCLIKNCSKVLCSSQQGILSLFSYGKWGDISDRFPGHPQSVDALLKIDEDTVLTGSSDGLVRAVQLLPNTLLGVLGSHEGFPVEELRWSAGRKIVGSLSHDEYIRLWDGSFLNDDDNDSYDGQGDDVMEEGETNKTKSALTGDDSDEWEDLDQDDENMNDSIDSDSDHSENRGDKPKTRPNIFKSANEEFFQDL